MLPAAPVISTFTLNAPAEPWSVGNISFDLRRRGHGQSSDQKTSRPGVGGTI